MDTPRQSKENLKQLVRDTLANQVFFSEQVRDPRTVPMVFLPLALGGLSYDVPKPELPPEPQRPEKLGFRQRPQRPKPDLDAVLPGLDAKVAEAQQKFSDIDFKFRWDEAPMSGVETARETLINALATRQQVTDIAEQAADTKYTELKAEYAKVLDAQRVKVAVWRKEHAAWEIACVLLASKMKEWEVGRDAYYTKLNETLGVIYAYYKDALPRSINGYPIFGSCCLLHKEDWKIVRAAIVREQERMKDIDIDGPENSGTDSATDH